MSHMHLWMLCVPWSLLYVQGLWWHLSFRASDYFCVLTDLCFMKCVNASKRNRNGALWKERVFLGHWFTAVLLLNSYFLYWSRLYRSVWRNRWTRFVSPVPFCSKEKQSRAHSFISTLISEQVEGLLRYVVFNVMQLEVTFKAICYSQ